MSDRLSISGYSLRQTKSESNIWNAILSLDAKYNHYRIQNSQLRTLYMRRKTQLLRENSNKFKDSNREIRQLNYNIRAQIFEHRFGPQDTRSISNLSTRHSKSQSLDSAQWREHYRKVFTNSKKISSIYSSRNSLNSDNSNVKARQRTLEEQYAFAGVYHVFDHHKAAVTNIKFANNDKSLLATCSLDGSLVICQLIPSPATIIYKLQGHTSGINDMEFSSNNDLIVSASSDGTSRVWQVSKGSCMRVLKDTCSAEVLCCRFLPLNENMIFTGNSKGFIQVYNSSTGILANKNCLQKINAKVNCICFDSKGKNLWIGDNKGCIYSFQFDILTLKLTNLRRLVNNSGYSITSLSFKISGDSTLLCNAAPNYLLLYKALPSGLKLSKRICIKQSIGTSIKSSYTPMISQQDKACVVCTGSEDYCVYIYNMECEEKPLVNRLQGHSATVLDVCFNYDESLLVSGDAQGTVIVWKREDNEKILSILRTRLTFTRHLSKMSNSFEFICKSPDNFPVQVEKYKSKLTGLRLYVSNVSGPVVDGYISVATEAHNDDGLPHTLEHMIFLGSESYPYPGVLDLMANKIYASGTNAWTEVDNTTYTLSTLEKHGFLQMLPIYLDHIFYPLLNESGYITEVYHINGEGEDAGVVYSEMQSCENDDETIVERRIHKLLYPNENCGYRYDTGGVLKNIRDSLTYQKVCEYHSKMYKPDNIAIVVAGEISAQEVIQVVEKFEEKIFTKKPETWKLDFKPFSNPIAPLMNTNIHETVYFPVDNEKTSNGLVSIGWRGPTINSFEELIALDVLLGYLTESSISPMASYFIEKNSICSRIQYNIEEYKETSIIVSFINTQLEQVNDMKPKFDNIISEIITQPAKFDLERMRNILKMKISEVIDKLEDDPHDTVSRICIGDFLYGDNTQKQFHERLSIVQTFERLKTQFEIFWIDLLKKWIHLTPSVVVIAKPSEELMKENGKADKQRVAERKTKLGKKGLKELAKRVENAIEENDNTDVPDEVLDQMQVPLLNNVKLKDIKTIETNTISDKNDALINCENMNHLQLQIDHIDKTNFAQLALLIDTNKIDFSLRKYLQLYIKLLFELPIKNDSVDLTHDQVVFELNKDLLEYDASIGIDGSEFDSGIYPQYLWIYIKVTLDKFEESLKWLKFCVFDSVFDENEIKVNIEKLNKEITRRKQQPLDLLHTYLVQNLFIDESNLCQNSIINQEQFLKEIGSNEDKNEVRKALNLLRESLLKADNLRFYVCSDLIELSNKLGDKSKFNQIWCKYFSKNLIQESPKFDVLQTWKIKKDPVNKNQNNIIISLGSTESSYLRVVSPISINSYKDPDYPGLLVLKEYFCQSEGPLWEAVRGPGYCYYESIFVNPECAQLELCLDECSNLTKAYEASKNLFMEYVGDEAFDEELFETAKNSLVYLLIDSLKSISNLAEHSMLKFFKGTDKDSLNTLLKNIENVQIEDLERLHKNYLMRLFNDQTSHCFIVCNPSKLDLIVNDFKNKFHRNLDKVENFNNHNLDK